MSAMMGEIPLSELARRCATEFSIFSESWTIIELQ